MAARIFLGLSAFLIAAVLLRELDRTRAEHGSPTIDGRDFARRRGRRLYRVGMGGKPLRNGKYAGERTT